MKAPEIRQIALPAAEVRAPGEADIPRLIVGKAVVYNSLSANLCGFRERFVPGAFADCLAGGADVRALVNHESRLVLGRSKAGTLRLLDGPEALSYELDAPETSYANDLLISLGRNDIDGMSFRFYCLEDRWEVGEDQLPLRTVLKADIDEISVVTFPAYLDAVASARSTEAAVRSLEQFRSGQAKAKPSKRERMRIRLAESE